MKKKRIKLWIFAVCILFSVAVVTSTTVLAASYNGCNYTSDYTQWKQGDSAWGSKKLGNLCTMSNSGCLVTSIAIQMARSGVENPNTFCPGTLRDRLEAGGFISHASTVQADGNLNYAAAFSNSNSSKFTYSGMSDFHPTPYNSIYSTLVEKISQGYYAVVNVKYGGHWVAVSHCSDGEVYINDPAGNGYSRLRQYDGGIESAIYFKADKRYVDNVSPSISNIKVSNRSREGYTVTCTVTDNAAVDRVQFPTWTVYNDQDDIDGNWWDSSVSRGSKEGTKYTFRVNRSSHNNEYGDYVTHIYAFDTAGNYSSAAVPTVNVSDFTYNPGKTIANGIYNIVSTVNRSYELSIKQNSNVSGANVHLWSRVSGNKYSKFEFTYISNGYYRIKNVGSGLVLDVWGAGGSGSNLVQYSSHGGDNQLFRIYRSSNGGYYLVPKNAPHCCIDLEGGNVYNGNNVRIWEENYTKAESWYLIAQSKPASTSKKNQTVSANSFIKTYGDKAFSVGAKTSGNGKLVYSSNNTKVATVTSSGKVTIKGIGIAQITITASETSEYKKVSKVITVTVRPKTVSLSGLKNSKSRKLTISWKRNSSVTGYKIQVATNSSFNGAKTYVVKGNNVLNKTVSVQKGKRYYVRICTYKGSINSSWSGAKKLKINK